MKNSISKQDTKKLEQEAKRLAKENQKLTSRNEKQKDTIKSLRKEVKKKTFGE